MLSYQYKVVIEKKTHYFPCSYYGLRAAQKLIHDWLIENNPNGSVMIQTVDYKANRKRGIVHAV